VEISDSTAQSAIGDVRVAPSAFGNQGQAVVVGSTLQSGGGAEDHGLVVASCTGGPGVCGDGAATEGRVEVEESTLNAGAAGNIFIETEALGRTSVRRNTLLAGEGMIFIHAGAGGSCESIDNAPVNLACM
jgi:hypothetical protein